MKGIDTHLSTDLRWDSYRIFLKDRLGQQRQCFLLLALGNRHRGGPHNRIPSVIKKALVTTQVAHCQLRCGRVLG